MKYIKKARQILVSKLDRMTPAGNDRGTREIMERSAEKGDAAMKKVTTMEEAMLQFKGKGEAYIICGASEPDGEMGLAYQGDLHQLKAMYRYIRDTLKEEGIGNHPNRGRKGGNR